jgi:hypothetical protein
MECVSSFLAGNNCNLDALMSESLEDASAAGERLLAELRSDPDVAKQRTFEEVFLKQLGLYCASREKGSSIAQLPLQPKLMKCFERMAMSSIRSMLVNATIESIAGLRESQDLLISSFSYAIEGISVSDVIVDPELTSFQAFQGRVSLRTSGLSMCLNGVHWMYRQLGFPYVQDQGVANVLLSNVSISIDWATALPAPKSAAAAAADCSTDITSVVVKVGDVDIKIAGTNPRHAPNPRPELLMRRSRRFTGFHLPHTHFIHRHTVVF